jgi:hypothetical protein
MENAAGTDVVSGGAMKKIAQMRTFIAVIALVVPAFADTLVLKNGEKITGYYEGGTARVIKFRAADGAIKDYDLLSVQEIQFGEDKAAAAPAPAPVPVAAPAISAPPAINSAPVPVQATAPTAAAAPSADPRLLPGNQRPTRPVSATAATTGFTIPTGSKIVIRTIDSINSEKNKVGDVFVAVLDEPVVDNGMEVIPKGVDVRGRLSNADSAGRVTGSAQLGLELTQIYVNGIPYLLTTSEYEEVGESRSGQTAKRAAGGAAIGALIGAIAGGGKGAAIGAGVGGGGATAVQVMTKGEKVNVPSETRLEFTLRSPLVIASR